MKSLIKKSISTSVKSSETGKFNNYYVMCCHKQLPIYRSYDVDFIVETRVGNGKKEYLCKWKRFGHRDNTWVPLSAFDDPTMPQEHDALDNEKKRKLIRKYEVAMQYEQNWEWCVQLSCILH